MVSFCVLKVLKLQEQNVFVLFCYIENKHKIKSRGKGKYRSTVNKKIAIKRETLAEKMTRSPDERHK